MRQIKVNLFEKVLISLIYSLYVYKLSVWYFIDFDQSTIQLTLSDTNFLDNIYIQLLLKSTLYYLIYIFLDKYGFRDFSIKEWIKSLILFLIAYLILFTLFSICKTNYFFQSPIIKNVITVGSGFLYASHVAINFLTLVFIYIIFKKSYLFSLDKKKEIGFYDTILINSVAITFYGYILLFYLLATSEIFNTSDGSAILMVFFIPPTIASTFINIFKVFPNKEKRFGINKVLQTLIAPFVFTCVSGLIYYLLASRLEVKYLAAQFLFQVLFSWPISQFFYSQLKSRFGEISFLEEKLVTVTADLQLLRSQINPHFLFNTLNMIYGNALQEKAIKTAESVQRLGDMMRFMLYENNNDYIPLSQELSYIENYIALQRLRLDNNDIQDFKVILPVDNEGYSIAPMLLLPFVENAFKHGVNGRERSWIDISLTYTESGIEFSVRNSLGLVEFVHDQREYSGIGIKNVQERLNILYPEKHSLNLYKGAKEYNVRLLIDLK